MRLNLRSAGLGLALMGEALACRAQARPAGRGLPHAGRAQTRTTQATRYETPGAPLLGAAWYPEQWPESAWEHDLTLMEAAHFNVVRIGEFAWSTLEPSEGRYELDWMERAIAMAARHHIAVVIGTPTDAPPAWMTTKYPDVLGMNEDGRWREHGGRRQFNYASPRYRKFCAEIVRRLAERFGRNANVIGWQIGNELTDESFDPATRRLYQQYLKAKFGTLANLNRHWAADCGPQPYTEWSQVPLDTAGNGPGQLLEHKHFVTATWRSFVQTQTEVLRPRLRSGVFVTTNVGGLSWSDNWDHYALNADLDMASWDDYVGEGHLDATKNAMLNDFVRGWKRQNFWVMETEPASVNWAPVNNALWPGETRALAWQTVGHGADAVLYWQWRDARGGQEQYHGAIVGQDGEPLPVYAEIARLGEDFAATREALAGTRPQAQVALLYDYDSRWAIDFQPFTGDYDQQKVLLRFYAPLEAMAEDAGEAVDIVDPQMGNLRGYRLLVAPSLNVLPPALAQRLLTYVRGGGHLLLGPRTGMKDVYDALNPEQQPGPLRAALGGHVDEYYALAKTAGLDGMNGRGMATIWGETLKVDSPETRVLLHYGADAGWLAGAPALIERKVGAGSIGYLGTLPDEGTMRLVLAGEMRTAGASEPSATTDARSADKRSADPPGAIEVCVRVGSGGRKVAIAVNHSQAASTAQLPWRMRSIFVDGTATGSGDATKLQLRPQGVAVLLEEARP